jgi:hypothetical protein
MVRECKQGVLFWRKESNDFSDAVADRAGGTNTCIRQSLLILVYRKEGLACCVPVSGSAERPVRIDY